MSLLWFSKLALLSGSIKVVRQKEMDLSRCCLWITCLCFDLAPALSQVGWIANPLLVEFVLLVELLVFIWLTKFTFLEKIIKRGETSFFM